MATSDNWMQSNSGTVLTTNGVGTTSNDLLNNEQIYNVIVHHFKIYEFDDPILSASDELLRWEKSPAGQWVMNNAIETPIWHTNENYALVCIDFIIKAKLKAHHYTYWMLKWGAK
jgi:hypothetical protein